MAAPVILVEARPRRAADGAAVTVRLAGLGADWPYRYGGAHWRAGIAALPRSIATLDFDGEQLGGGGIADAVEIAWAPARGTDLAELAELFWTDAPVTVRYGPEGPVLPPVLVTGLVLSASVEGGTLRLALADRGADLKRPVLVERFAGTGGIEGPVEWQGLIKSRAWGRCFNVPGRLIDAGAGIWCFGDPTRAWRSLVQVRDRGVPYLATDTRLLAWQGSAAATLAALRLAVAPEGGLVVAPSIACARPTLAASGDLRADIEGEVAGGYVETAAAIAERIVGARSTIPFAPGALAAAAAARPASFGWRIDGDATTAAEALSEMLAGVSLSWLLVDDAIRFRTWDWTAPVRRAASEGVARNRVHKPVATRTIGYRRNQAPMARGDLAAIVLAGDVTYGDGTPVEALKPAQPGADVTQDAIETSRYALAKATGRIGTEARPRFDPLFWTTNFESSMMASVRAEAADALRLDAVFLARGHLAGLIWASEDHVDHPTTAYDTDRDYRGCVLRFRIAITGDAEPLNAINGPTLAVEGRDAAGAARTWYVRLANAVTGGGTPAAPLVELDFDRLPGGFDGREPVYAGDVDRLLISFVPGAYAEGSAEPLAAPAACAVTLSDMAVSGHRGTLVAGTGPGGVHEVRMANGYDDTYNVTPERIVRNLDLLGYRGVVNHYVGMSHYFRWRWDAGEGRYLAEDVELPLNAPALAWHRGFAARLKESGRELILSLSYDMLARFMPAAWRQLDRAGVPAATGWEPPSSLFSPCHAVGMAYLKKVARQFAAILAEAELPVRFQVGEPWYWIDFRDQRPCFYDPATVAAWTAATGTPPPAIDDMKAPMDKAQRSFLDYLGARLAASVLDVLAAVKAAHPGAVTYALLYLPQLLDRRTPEAHRVNMPAGLAYPALDVLQLEDYDFVIDNRPDLSATGRREAERVLGYPRSRQEYFAGFALHKDTSGAIWRASTNALADARDWGVERLYIWAYTQVCRDGYVPSVKSAPPLALRDLGDVERFDVQPGRFAQVRPGGDGLRFVALEAQRFRRQRPISSFSNDLRGLRLPFLCCSLALVTAKQRLTESTTYQPARQGRDARGDA